MTLNILVLRYWVGGARSSGRPVLRKVLISLVWLCASLIMGCATVGQHSSAVAAFADFRSATKSTSDQVAVVIGRLNKVERDALIDNAIAEGDSLKLNQIEKVQTFSQGDVDVLVKSAEVLDRYSELLQALASSDAADSVSGRVSVLGKSLSEFQGSSKVINVDNANVRKARAACGALSEIASEASKWIVQYKVDHALNKVILASDPSVQRLAGILEDCVDVASQRTESALSQARVNAITKMQQLKNSGLPDAASSSRMEKLADELKVACDNLSNFKRSNPTASLAELKRAHTALVTYVKSGKTPRDFSEMVTVLEGFSNSAERSAKAVNALRGL
jgi:hypothetical protein